MSLRQDAPTSLLEHSKQKRARGQLSCTPCRVGKLKCNRLRDPACDQCLKRGREAACQYVPPPTKTKSSSNVKGRIRQLETLVKDLMTQQSAHSTDQPTPPSDGDELRTPPKRKTNIDASVETSLGNLDLGGGAIAYTGENHWQTILSSLKDIQQDLADDEGGIQDNSNEGISETQPAYVDEASVPRYFLLGNIKAMTRAELLQSIPEKRVTDRLLSLWFNSPDPFKIVVHAPTFQEEYKRLWEDQSVSTMWLGLLFAILCLSESFRLRNSSPSNPPDNDRVERVQHYQSLAASAAVLAEYTKPKEYTIECLLLYMVGLRSENAAMHAWIIMGIIVRLAFRMGYHRDPGHYPKITQFQAEMRRRVWTMTSMIDVLMSFQLGLPSMVRTAASDTKPPSNLLDRDFSRTMLFLPPGRGEDELTPSLYSRVKLGIMHIFAQAVELSHAVVPASYETIQGLAADLEKAKENMPQALRMPDISELVTDPAEQLMYRFNIDLLFSKCRIVLFRRYMLVPLGELSEEEQKRGIGEGREACIKSARRVLDHHHTIYSAIQPGGQLENMRWYMGSIAVHDFLLAAMVICLELSQQMEKDKMLRISNGMQCPTRQAMLRALERSYDIWSTTTNEFASTIHTDYRPGYKGGDMYEETEKASKAMAAMLARIRAQDSRTATEATAPSPAKTSVFDEGQHYYFDNVGLTRSGARAHRKEGVHGVLTIHDWGDVPNDFQFNPTPQSAIQSDSSTDNQKSQHLAPGYALLPDQAASQIDFDIGDPMNLDWQAWDSEIFNIAKQGRFDEAAEDLDFSMYNTEASSQMFSADQLPNTSGMQFSIEDMQNIDIGVGNFYTPFIENAKNAAWNRNPR
ncbi:hypothetical protein AMS68_005848 [Peltaster fructicola]|uniref:Zn(2)-C6 fungal-type domain-containing protein n=1 Tax=Peltaster fructicola TaxID=286661 RepID=A0A6H0Y084_9PEZI|nr:hypothetical protein AMS68_005848 [Peltaster fructicola]